MQYAAVDPNASLVLAPGVAVDAGCLRDATGRRHPVDPYGALVARFCPSEVSVGGLTRAMTLLSGQPEQLVDGPLRAYVYQLQAQGLMSVNQSFFREFYWELVLWPTDVAAFVLTRKLPGRRFASRRMYAATIPNLTRAVIEAFSFLFAIALVFVLLVALGTTVARPLAPLIAFDRVAVLGLVIGGPTLMLVGASFAHELGHLAAAKALRLKLLAVQARRSAASVLIAPGQATQTTRWAILAGPLSGALFAAVCAIAFLNLTTPDWLLTTVDTVRLSLGSVACLIFAAQILCLLPLFGDGRALRQMRRDGHDNP